mmetsp:Transcript_32404/g.78717  ORF Transcript_32404/g.78717 Transcript_32404/m.78717 type:complete len:103 (+) Transcript_32404:147-455(+)
MAGSTSPVEDFFCCQWSLQRTEESSMRTSTKSLANWVKRQRAEYKKFKGNQPSSMTAERVAELERLGFQFKCREDTAQLSKEEKKQRRREQNRVKSQRHRDK